MCNYFCVSNNNKTKSKQQYNFNSNRNYGNRRGMADGGGNGPRPPHHAQLLVEQLITPIRNTAYT